MGTAHWDQRKRRFDRIGVAAVAAAACAAVSGPTPLALATAFTWEDAVNGVWTDTTKWTPPAPRRHGGR
jgi:hypothetical protein